MGGFTKLWSEIISSSIWNEDDKTRIIWVTMLAMSDANGLVKASIGSLAHLSRVDKESTKRSIEILSSPDTDSRSEEFEGRRIKKVDGGFLILNYGKYRKQQTKEERREYMRLYMQDYRSEDDKEDVNSNVNNGKQQLAMLGQAEAEAEAEAEADKESVAIAPCKKEFWQFKTEDDLFLARFIYSIFGRRPTTELNESEMRAFKRIKDYSKEDLDNIKWLHEINHPWRRKKLQQLCNNFHEEVEKAKQYKTEKNYGIPSR